ncbi:MAG: SPFH domain-containing protein [Tannerellaceae bacterium]|jgi:regulator of protease activity HflC (stomatin/prohibitin superfamily)|nr:SPFH domain-containing protein [Tannerellaceae bacterium]
METKEKAFKGVKVSGFVALAIAVFLVFCLCFYVPIGLHKFLPIWVLPVSAICGGLSIPLLLVGLTIIEPNEARVVVFFGKYKGTLTDNGFFWINPFNERKKITLRARNLDVLPVKVNDKVGNPVMIGAVMVWKVKDTYKAMFDIDSSSISTIGSTGKNSVWTAMDSLNKLPKLMHSYENFVKTQSDAALRQIAGMYAYDSNESMGDNITLRSGDGEVARKLEEEINSRLAIAGLEVVEARINYLAYASEIAGVMLRRQQADAIISAREKIVEGAVSMVQLALGKLEKENIVQLDEEKKAAMVSNLLVVLCADEAAQPVLNTGTLHH